MGWLSQHIFLGKKSCNKKILNAEQSRRACHNSTCESTRAPRKQPALLKSVPWCGGEGGGLALCKLAIPGLPAFLLYLFSISYSPFRPRGIPPPRTKWGATPIAKMMESFFFALGRKRVTWSGDTERQRHCREQPPQPPTPALSPPLVVVGTIRET